jgi:hypothetical protein
MSLLKVRAKERRESQALQNEEGNPRTPRHQRDIHLQDQTALLRASILGVQTFVFIGFAKSFLNVVFAALGAEDSKYITQVQAVKTMIGEKMDPMFLVATVICIINMFFLSKISTVKQYVTNPNMKFNATRALLLIGQGQLLALKAACNGSHTEEAKYNRLMNIVHKSSLTPLKKLGWQFDDDQARLLHANMLVLECCIIIIVNLWFFKADEQKELIEEHQRDLDSTPDADTMPFGTNGFEAPLLP